jgi:hypothetical protein
MAYPPPVLPINRDNATPQQDTHPADHNAVNLAVNDITTVLGPWPPGGSATVMARFEAIENKMLESAVALNQSGQVFTPGQYTQMNWDGRSNTNWGTGWQLICPPNGLGFYGVSVTIDSPAQMPAGGYADVVVHMASNLFYAYIPQGKSHVTLTAMLALQPGQGVWVDVYNPIAQDTYYMGQMTIDRLHSV